MKQYAPVELIDNARKLRVTSTEVEKRLWNRLRDRQVLGVKFRRQHPMENYILDFACEERKLGIELDGAQHNAAENQTRDVARSRALEQSGWQIIRFWNNEVIENMEGVLESIQQALTRNHEG